jgi:hypothetical protein
MERHRHRYEFNNDYREKLSAAGLRLTGTSPNGELVEIVELKDHPWFLGCQFHPEFKSRPMKPHPLFKDYIGAAIEYKHRLVKPGQEFVAMTSCRLSVVSCQFLIMGKWIFAEFSLVQHYCSRSRLCRC